MAIFGDCNMGGSDFILDFLKCTFASTDVGAGSIAGLAILFGGMFALLGFLKVVYGFERSAIGTTFAGVVASFIFAKLGWVGDKVPYLCIALFIASLFYLQKATEDQ